MNLGQDILEFYDWIDAALYDAVEEDTPVAVGKVMEQARKKLNNIERKALDTQRLKREVRDAARERLHAG